MTEPASVPGFLKRSAERKEDLVQRKRASEASASKENPKIDSHQESVSKKVERACGAAVPLGPGHGSASLTLAAPFRGRCALPNFSVMRGLVPRIHVFSKPHEDVDGRDKRGHDGKTTDDHRSAISNFSLFVIPGRAVRREPGTHSLNLKLWVPGSSLRDAPG